jgi:hypothetical protein
MEQLSADLQGAVLRPSSDVMFAVTIPKNQTGTGDAQVGAASWSGANIKPGDSAAPSGSLQLNPADRDLDTYRFGQAGSWLRLFSVPSDNSTTGLDDLSAPRAVAYQIVRRRIGSATAPFNYQLFRTEVRPFGTSNSTSQASTFSNGYDLFGANGYNDPSLPEGGTLLADAGVVRTPRAEYVLGDGVIDFGVRIFVRNTTGALVEAFPVNRRINNTAIRRVFASTTADATVASPRVQPSAAFAAGNNFTVAETSYGYPAVVEVMVRILTPDGIEIIQAYEDDPARFGGAGKWWELAEANSKVFTRRIEVRSAAL